MNVLPFCRIHKYQVIRPFQAMHHFQGISLNQINLLFLPCPFKIRPGYRNSFIIIFYCCNMPAFRHIFTHKN